MIRPKTRWLALAALGMTACATSSASKPAAPAEAATTPPPTEAPAEATAEDTAAAPAQKAHPQDKHLLWKIEADGHTVYLLGSIHMLKPDVYPLSPVIEQAFSDSDVVGFEIDFAEMLKAGALASKLSQYPGKRTLKSELPKKTYALLATELKEIGLDIKKFHKTEPWMLSLSLTQIVLLKHGYRPDAGIDLHFYKKAKAAGKEIIAMETAEYQIRMLDGIPAKEQEAQLHHLASEFDDLEATVAAYTEAWLAGDGVRLSKLLKEDMGDSPTLWHQVIVVRNQSWVPKIEALIGKKDAIIIVGAGHLVGDESVVALLRERGHTVTQL